MNKIQKKIFEEIFKKGKTSFEAGFGVEYNTFCCEQGIVIAETLKDKDVIISWKDKIYKEQKIEVPGLDDGHSGNTFEMSVKLAILYLPYIKDRLGNDII